MAKLWRWRITDRLPLSYRATIPVLGLVIIISTASFQLLPESKTWGDNFSTLLMHVAGTSLKDSSAENFSSHRHSPWFVDNVSSSLSPLQSFQSPAIAPSDQEVAPLATNTESLAGFNISEKLPWSPAISPDVENGSVANRKSSSKASDTSAATPATSATRVPSPALLVSMDNSSSGSTEEGEGEEKFLVPLLSYQVGAGNQFMEYQSAAVMARALNRTLCLSAFFPGPSRHTGRVTSAAAGLAWEERYDVASLARFTRTASLPRCAHACGETLHDKWMLKPSREPHMSSQWKTYPRNNEALDLKWDYVKWTALEDINATLGTRTARCVGMLGLFPGLRWRGAFLATSAFIRPAACVTTVADALQAYALGDGTLFLAVHWRFEESECRGQHVGLCFMRCHDSSVINSGLRPPDAQAWRYAAEETRCSRNGSLRGVTLHKHDVVDAIHERALNHSVTAVYLATDGWLRGPASVALVTEVVERLRGRGLSVTGLWKVPRLPNFSNGQYFDPTTTTLGKGLHIKDLNGAQVALVEQELCSRAVSFLGSGPSTFSLSVFRVRLARRRVKQIESSAAVTSGVTGVAMDELVAETLLRDAHPAGLHCRYLRYMKRAEVTETAETDADEYPDGWLDLEACEGRIGRGGRCRVAQCF